MFLLTGNKAECSGCSACQQICGHGSISMQADEDGFLFPVKDLTTCVDCGLCEKVCPFVKPDYNNPLTDAYAAMAKAPEERAMSSSGGLFYLIAKRVIEQGGIVYGAILDENMQVRHAHAESLAELTPLRGSKYVQSNLDDTYRQIRSNLREGRLVYFTGVGCQVAGLKSFLIKQYDNLITSDLVCHGVPNQKLFDEHIAYLQKRYKGTVVDYKFRDNKKWGGCEIVYIQHKSGHIKVHTLPTYDLSPYLYSFMYSMTVRMSCYSCPFAKTPRQGDITLADYWGAQVYFPELDHSKGISLVTVNTPKGDEIIKNIESELIIEKSNIKEASHYNGNLVHNTEMPPIRASIFELIRKEGYKHVAQTVFRPPYYNKLYLKSKLRALIGDKVYTFLKSIIKR